MEAIKTSAPAKYITLSPSGESAEVVNLISYALKSVAPWALCSHMEVRIFQPESRSTIFAYSNKLKLGMPYDYLRGIGGVWGTRTHRRH